MTHEQLVQRVTDDFFFTQGLGTAIHYNSCVSSPCHCDLIDRTHLKLRDAMLAIVELHKRDVRGNCDICTWITNGGFAAYPCPTIQAIEKELE